MPKLLVGNAPCSWGTLEFEEAKGEQIGYSRMLDELAKTVYTGTELGDWGYMPTEPDVLRNELRRRGLVMLGAFVPVALKDPRAHDAGTAGAVKIVNRSTISAGLPVPVLGCEPSRTGKSAPSLVRRKNLPKPAYLSPSPLPWRLR